MGYSLWFPRACNENSQVFLGWIQAGNFLLTGVDILNLTCEITLSSCITLRVVFREKSSWAQVFLLADSSREKIVPPDPISQNEKASVLQRLNQIIQHRLVTSKMPSQLSNLSISE